ncbi:uncharacterized protein [Rhodnius prolixus]
MFHPSLRFALLAVFIALCFSEAYGTVTQASANGYGNGTSIVSSQNDDGDCEGGQDGCGQGEGEQGTDDQGTGDQGGCDEDQDEGCQQRKKRSPEDAQVTTASASGFGNGSANAISSQKGSGGEQGSGEECENGEGDSKEGDSEEGDSEEGDSEEGDSEEGDSEEGDSEEGDSEEGDSEEGCDGSCENCNDRKKRSPEFGISAVPRSIQARAETSRYRDAAGSATGYGQGSGSSQSSD